jgi:tetratricopeptide (TPR) repeat protein
LERLLKNARNRESHLAWKMLHECYSMGLEIAYGKGVGSGLEAAVRRNEAEPAGRTADRARLTERLVEFEIRLAKAWEFVGEEAEARRLYDRVVREGETVEKVSVAMKELAQIYEKQGDCTKLVHLYRALAALTNDPFSHQFYAYRTARTYERMGLFSRAISSYRKMSGMRSLGKEFQSAALFRLGLLYKMGFGTEAEAAEHFRKCLDLEPNHPKARAALGITGETLAGSSLSCLREGVR